MWKILIAIGVIFIVLGFYRILKYSLKKNWEEVEGKIVGCDQRIDRDNDGFTSTVYTPIIEYFVNGVEYTYQSKVYSSNIPKSGKKIMIKYNPEDPNDAVRKIDDVAITYTIFGVVFIIFGIIVVIANNR